MISRLIAAEIPDEHGNLRKLDDIEITGFTTLLGGAGAETVTKLIGSAVVEFARHPEQWQNCSTTAAGSPPPSRNCCVASGRCSTTCATA